MLNGSLYGRGGKNYYLGQRGVSGTYLRWWNTVMVNDVVVRDRSPRVGLEIGKGRFSITPSVQHFRLVARDYAGEDCVGCRITSSVIASTQLESGISPRGNGSCPSQPQSPVPGNTRNRILRRGQRRQGLGFRLHLTQEALVTFRRFQASPAVTTARSTQYVSRPMLVPPSNWAPSERLKWSSQSWPSGKPSKSR
jgi:hypothetical protein